jgi:hypothetical protein
MHSNRLSTTRTAIALLVSFLALPLAAAVPSGDGWKQLESENFIVFSNLDDAATQEIGLDLERCWRSSSPTLSSSRRSTR